MQLDNNVADERQPIPGAGAEYLPFTAFDVQFQQIDGAPGSGDEQLHREGFRGSGLASNGRLHLVRDSS